MPNASAPGARALLIEAGSFLGKVWQLARPYWRSSERREAWLLLAAIIALTLFLVFMEVQFNRWNREFYDSLQERQFDTFKRLLAEFCGLAAIFIVAAAYTNYLTAQLQMRWRIWLTREYLGEWFDRQTYYRLGLESRGTDNPDQRIAEDIRLFTDRTLNLSLGVLSAVVTLVSFVGILWVVSGPLELGGVTIPAYMVWVALAYAIVGSLITYLVGRRLIPLNFEKERVEADLRFGLVRLRENAEGVALYRGEAVESRGLLERIERVRLNWAALIQRTKHLQFMTATYQQIAIVFPFIVAAPRYFSGAISLGQLTQISSAFGQVQGALSFFVTNFAGAGGLAAWKASVDRLLSFHTALEATRTAQATATAVRVADSASEQISAHDLEIALPDARVVIAGANFTLARGERVLLAGPSGSGKSTLFRTLAGIWPYARGRIVVPQDAQLMFLPQRPYLPIGSLRDALAYPAPPERFAEAEYLETLERVRLEQFAAALATAANWSQAMSPGEQQRLAIARALLHRPQWLFLDEATASLDEATEAHVYHTLLAALPDSAIVSIAHRRAVADYHGRRWTIADRTLSIT